MHSSELKIPYGCTMFTEIHIHMKGLLPVLLHAFENKDKIGRAIRLYRGDIHGYMYGRYFCPAISGMGNTLSCELELDDSPDFAKAYALSCVQWSQEIRLHRCIKQIKLLQFGAAEEYYHKLFCNDQCPGNMM